MIMSKSEDEVDMILLKILRPHPYIQPEDKLFLTSPKIVEAKQALNKYYLAEFLKLTDKADPQTGNQASEKYWGNQLRKLVKDKFNE